MRIAYTMAEGRGDTDLLLHNLAEELASQGIRCCGTVQINTARAEGPCDMDVKVLPDGPTLRISQSLGTASKGCRLDPAALEHAVGLTDAMLVRGVDILIINKFGKHEADGRGFRNTIAQAIAADIPILIGVNALNFAAFKAFAGDDLCQITPALPELLHWCRGAIAATQSAA